jgi:hypothetical protein
VQGLITGPVVSKVVTQAVGAGENGARSWLLETVNRKTVLFMALRTGSQKSALLCRDLKDHNQNNYRRENLKTYTRNVLLNKTPPYEFLPSRARIPAPHFNIAVLALLYDTADQGGRSKASHLSLRVSESL